MAVLGPTSECVSQAASCHHVFCLFGHTTTWQLKCADLFSRFALNVIYLRRKVTLNMECSPEAEPLQAIEPDEGDKRKHTPRRKQVKLSNRKQKACPYPNCTGKVTDMYRHFKCCHDHLTPQQMKKYIDTTKKKAKQQRSYPDKICCMPGCGWTGKRPDVHLMAKRSKKSLTSGHNMDRASALKMAKLSQVYIPNEVDDMQDEDDMSGNIKAETLIKNFETWLLSYEGGKYVSKDLPDKRKKAKLSNVSKIAHHVRTIIQLVCGSKSFPPTRLRMLRYLGNSPDKSGVIDLLSKDLSWPTIRNYLASYSHFLAYMKSLPEWCVTWASKIELESINVAYARTMTTVCKLSREAEQKRKQTEHAKLVDLEVIAAYLDSNVLKEARKLCLTKLKPEDSLSQILHYYNNARNHLILTMTLTNAKRSGVLSGMLMSEVNTAAYEKGVYTFDVLCGKTYASHGASTVTCDQADYEFLQDFIKNLRPAANPTCDQVFVNMHGQSTETSEINRYLKTAWKDFEEELGKPLPAITCSIIRKTWVSKSRDAEVTREEQMKFAIHMDHSLSTADNHYSVSARRVASVRTRNIMKDLLDRTEYDSESSGSESERHSRPVTPRPPTPKRRREHIEETPTPKTKKEDEDEESGGTDGVGEAAEQASLSVLLFVNTYMIFPF